MTYTQTLETIARIIDPDAWKARDRFKQIIAGDPSIRYPADPEQRASYVRSASNRVDTIAAASLAKAAQIASLLPISQRHVVPEDQMREAVHAAIGRGFIKSDRDCPLHHQMTRFVLEAIATAIRARSASPTDAGVEARLIEALTPSGDTKAAYIGEIKDSYVQFDEFGDEHTVTRPVSWDATKATMKMILERARVSPPLPMVKEEGK